MDTYEIINSSNVEKAFQEAKTLYEKSDFEKSISIFTNIINKYPNNTVIHNYLYCSYFNLKNYKESLYHIEKCLSDSSIENTYLLKEHYCRIFLNLKLYNKTRQLLVRYMENDNNLIYHQLMCELSKQDNNPQYYDLYRKSAILLINNNFANIDVYIILLYIMTYQENTLSHEILHLINVILIYQTDKHPKYTSIPNELTFDNLEYRESFFTVFKDFDLSLAVIILLYHSFINKDTSLKVFEENLNIIGRSLSYEFITDAIDEFGDIIKKTCLYYIFTSEHIRILIQQMKIMCPKLKYQSLYLLGNKQDTSDKRKIAFIAYDWDNQLNNYQYNHLIHEINTDLYEIYLFGFKNNHNNDNHIILLDPNLEKNIHILSECQLDMIIYIDVASNLEMILLSSMKLSNNQFSFMQKMPHLKTLSMEINSYDTWLGGYYPKIDTLLSDYPIIDMTTQLFPLQSNIYIIFHSIKYFTDKYISLITSILEKDPSGLLVVNLSSISFGKLLKLIPKNDSNTLIATRIHNLPFHTLPESCRLISQSTVILDIGDNYYDTLTVPLFIQSIHYGIPFISLNTDIKLLLKRLNLSHIIVNVINDYLPLIMKIINDANFKLQINKDIIDSKEYLFESKEQIDIFHTFLNDELNQKPSDSYSELENMLFN